jgi:gliding motility-associated-like protein
VFYDMKIDVAEDLFLDISVGVTHFQKFVNGRVQTPRDNRTVSLDYINDAPYFGENNNRYINGYSSIIGVLDFTFPIGDDFRLRPMRIDNQAAANTARGAYFFENPNLPDSFPDNFNTDNLGDALFEVSPFEFWDLDGNVETRVTLTWDDNSNISTLTDKLEDLRVVGWDKNVEQWVDLGNSTVSGDLNTGEITSELILPDLYIVLTFGSLDDGLKIFTAISPNGDGANDTFIIQNIFQFPNNELSIFNRWGVKVYNKKGYDNSWAGISEGRTTLDKGEELPVGTYYYILKINNKEDRSGYLYINR